jgi:predicted NBD/HSP70 family sugar kinase
MAERVRQGADHSTVRELNRSLVLDLLRAGGPASRASIARSTSLAKPTVSAIVDELITDGLVREVGMGATATAGGRPPILLEFNARSQLVAGVHVGARRTTVALADATGVEIARRELATPRGEPADTLRRVAVELRAALAGCDADRAAAVGLVLPGLTDFHAGVCLLAPNLGWRDVPVAALLTAELGVPVHVHNAGQAAAVAENLEGAGGRVGDLALLYAGTGLSAGILTGGRLLHGVGGTAGEIGHCRVPGATEPCNCGRVGCLETLASGPALVRAARRARVAGEGPGPADAREVAAAAAAGDAAAAAAVAEVGRYLGLAASWLINAYNPAVLVVGGGLAAVGAPLLAPLRAAVEEYALPPALRGVVIRPSLLGRDAEVRGAVLLALQQSEEFYRAVFRG